MIYKTHRRPLAKCTIGLFRKSYFYYELPRADGEMHHMADIDLTQAEADALIAMQKCRTGDDVVYYPAPGGSLTLPLASADKNENFLLDITRGRIKLSKPPTRTAPARW